MFFFQNLNLSDFNHRDVPLTEAKQIVQDACRAPIEQFIRDNYRAIINITGPDLFQMFVRYCKENKYPTAGYGKKIFIAEMREYTGPPMQRKIRDRNMKFYNLHPQVIEQLLELENNNFLG